LTVDKEELRQAWKKTVEEESPVERREAFESLAAGLLASIPGFIVAKRNIRASIGEVDILLRNEVTDPFLNKLGEHIIVECKAYQNPVKASEVAAFLGKMALHRIRTGFLFSSSGFTHEAVAIAGDGSRKDLSVVLVGPDDISDLIESDNRMENVKQAVTRSFLAR